MAERGRSASHWREVAQRAEGLSYDKDWAYLRSRTDFQQLLTEVRNSANR